MKFNWGHGIFPGILLFVGFILFLVYITTQQNLNLVDEDYYPKELLHQQQMDRIKNAAKFEEAFEIHFGTEKAQISFPEYFHDKEIDAEIQFYRPSNNHEDVMKNYTGLGSEVHEFKMSEFKPGIYVLKITWNAEEKSYYFEKEIAF